MRAGLRLAAMLWAAGLMVAASVPVFAQSAPSPTTNTPAADAVGPKELQNFSLSGTVTQPASPAPEPRASRAAPRTSQPATQAAALPAEPRSAAPPQPRRAEVTSAQPASAESPRTGPIRQSAPASSVTVALPKLGSEPPPASTASTVPAAAPALAEPPVGDLAPEHKLSLWPWLLAALTLGLGGGFLFWRGRSREAFAGGPQLNAFTTRELAPVPKPAPPKAPPPPVPGLVTTRLRPWIEISFVPLRCILDNERLVIEFELDLFNSGSAPARAVLAEASLFNAGPAQDRDIRAFFDNPVGEGERILSIPPLKRVAVRTQVVAARSQIQVYELAGKQVFVPVIAFNALYRWSGGEGQTSSTYLLGRDTKSDKMAPFRLDLGPRIFRGVGAHLLPAGVRR